jgi:glycine/serine hydroxymethyltransferase
MAQSKSMAQTIANARLLASGIRKNSAELTKRGIGEKRATEIETLAHEVEGLDNEQESLKARLKSVTDTLNQKAAALKAEMTTDIRIIKADAPQTMWKEFGIQAKK